MKKFMALIAVALVLTPMVAGAASLVNTSLGTTFGLGTAGLESTVIKVIQWILGLLGLVAVIMILIGGFQWMTAGGNEEKVASAKKIISAAVIGLIVVLLAWAIVIFVSQSTLNVTV